MSEKFNGHTPGPWFAVSLGFHPRAKGGYQVHSGGIPINDKGHSFSDEENVYFKREDAELCAAAPELLAENERLSRELRFFEAENAHIKASNHRLELQAIQSGSDYDRARLAARAENERLRARVAELEAELVNSDITNRQILDWSL